MKKKKATIVDLRHPEYTSSIPTWADHRLIYEGGERFRDECVVTFSARESAVEFYRRKQATNIPALAKSSVNEIKNSIFQRIYDVQRIGGPDNYTQATIANNNGLGVDLKGNSMNSFIGRVVIPELLVIGKIGIFVDKIPMVGATTLRDSTTVAPYIYAYKAEDILSWAHEPLTNKLNALMLRDRVDVVDEDSGLIIGTEMMYRVCRRIEGKGVEVKWYDDDANITREVMLNLQEIPFILGSLTQSLLVDVSSYQKALLNMASSDVAYVMNSNLPFYTEQFDAQAELSRILISQTPDDPTLDGSSANATGAQQVAAVGNSQGRRYPKGMERPGFINPSSEPLLASMKKQDQLKDEIRILVNLNVSSLMPSRASGESKKEDSKSLEAGLSYIGLELQYIENEIARVWSMYENTETGRVTYPKTYSIRADSDIRKEAEDYIALAKESPSLTYQKEIYKHVVRITLGDKISADQLTKIEAEIDSSSIIVIDSETINAAVEVGTLSRDTAAVISHYGIEEVAKANIEHADRAARIALAQQSVALRGAKDIDPNTETKLGKEGENDDTNNQ